MLPQHAQEIAFGLLLEATVGMGSWRPKSCVYSSKPWARSSASQVPSSSAASSRRCWALGLLSNEREQSLALVQRGIFDHPFEQTLENFSTRRLGLIESSRITSLPSIASSRTTAHLWRRAPRPRAPAIA